MNAMEKFEAAKSKAEVIKNEARAVMKDAFSECTKALFEENPTLNSFGWRQYTPYFNDGDECTFSAHIYDPDINEEDGYEIYGENPLNNLKKKVCAVLQKFDSEDFKEMFGDHSRITVTRDGKISSDSYDHD
jgi:hypothetical protein